MTCSKPPGRRERGGRRTKMRLRLGALAWSAAAFAASCLGPTEDRAVRDRAVGRAESPGLQVRVEHGHAAVRELDADLVHLWASAPTLRVELELGGDGLATGAAGTTGTGAGAMEAPLGAPRSVELFVENCMPRAVLEVVQGSATVTRVADPQSTHCRFQLRVETARLAVRLADPEADAPGSFHFGVLSDIQEAIDRVGDVYRRINQEEHLAFVLGAGDLTQQGAPSELRRFQQELKALDLPYYTTLGNHELGESPPAYHDYFGRGNSSFVFRGARFTLLDSASATIDPEVYDWLAGWLELGRAQTHVVAMHIPPLDPIGVRNGAFSSRNEAVKLLGRLAAGRVDLTLYGHIHSHYQFSNAGIPAHISGGGGAIPERFDGLGRHFLDVAVAERGIVGVRVVRVD